VNTVKRDNPPSHLLLGVTAVEMALDYSKRQLAEAIAWENVSRLADYAEPYPAEWGAPKLPDSPSNRMDVWKGEVIASTEEELLAGIQR